MFRGSGFRGLGRGVRDSVLEFLEASGILIIYLLIRMVHWGGVL